MILVFLALDTGLPAGKPLQDVIHSPPDIDEDWIDLYEQWLNDETGEVAPPPGYEGWSVERALEDYGAEYDRLMRHIATLWEDSE